MAIHFTPIIITAFVPFIGRYFQHKNAKIKEDRERKTNELNKVNEIFEDINTSMGALAFFNTQMMFDILYKDKRHDSEGLWRQYQEELLGWKRCRAKYMAETKTYFGTDVSQQLKDILQIFDDLESQVEATYHARKDSSYFLEATKGSDNDYRVKYMQQLREPLDDKMTLFNTHMSDKIQQLNQQNMSF